MATSNSSFRATRPTARDKAAGLVNDVVGQVPGLHWLQTSNVGHPLAGAMQEIAEQQMRADAHADVRRLGLTGVGVGAGLAGLAGLARTLRRRKPRTDDDMILPLPYPVEPAQAPRRLKRGLDDQTRRDLLTAAALGLGGGGLGAGLGALTAPAGKRREGATRGLLMGAPAGLGAFATAKGLRGFMQEGSPSPSTLAYLAGGAASTLPSRLLPRPSWERRREKRGAITTRSALPWYGPAMTFSGLGGLALGWKGVDSVLKARAKRERATELEAARREFHDALLSQYDAPLRSAPKTAAAELGRSLDRLYDLAQAALQKQATLADVAGMTAGGYGMYAGLSGLLTGAIAYNQMKKRSRRAILDKALARRQRRRFAEAPPEIYAMPEPMAAPAPPVSGRSAERLLRSSPEDSALAGD